MGLWPILFLNSPGNERPLLVWELELAHLQAEGKGLQLLIPKISDHGHSRSDVFSICYALCSGPVDKRKKVPTSLTFAPSQDWDRVLSPSQGSLEMASVKQYGSNCVFWNKVLKIMLLLCSPLKPVLCSEKPRVDTPLNLPGSPSQSSSPGNTCLGEEETRWFQSPALGQPGHSNLSKWDPRPPFCVPYSFLTHSICEHVILSHKA